MASKYIHFTEEQKQRANATNLEHYLVCKGEQLIKAGKDKRLKSDRSITIRGNEWYDHSKEVGGYAIDFVKMFYGMDFPTAVSELVGESGEAFYPSYEKKIEQAKPFILPTRNQTMKRVYAYLMKHRGIDTDVITFFVKKGLLYESREVTLNGAKEFYNLVFVGEDECGVARHAHKRSVYSGGVKFMQNIEGSNPKYSFRYLGGGDKLFVFEAPIDLLSYITLHKDKHWQEQNYLALCGVSSQPVLQILNERPEVQQVMLCLDNDLAGEEACTRISEVVEKTGKMSYRVSVK